MVFPVVMYGCESWTIKKAQHRRIDAFELWCWRRLLRVPLAARWSNQSILKEITPEYSLKGLILKLQYFGHLMWRNDSLEKTLMLGKNWRQGEKGMTEDEMVGWHHWLNGHEFEQALRVGEGQGSLVCCSPWDHKALDVSKQLNWTDSWLKISTVSSWTNCLHRDLSISFHHSSACGIFSNLIYIHTHTHTHTHIIETPILKMTEIWSHAELNSLKLLILFY